MKITLNPDTTPFSLDYTLQCGQVFRWQKCQDRWHGVVADKAVKIRQKDHVLEFEGVQADFVRKYFRLDDPLPRIASEISKDEHIISAIKAFLGLRLIQQEPWECLISYMCSTFNNIPRIKKMISSLAERFGDKEYFDGAAFHSVPSPKRLANASLKALEACNLGFRAKMVRETAKIIDSGAVRFEDLKKLNYEEARQQLLRLPGVGYKVADCVLLFSLNKLEAFPVDVWIKKSVLRHYGSHFENGFVRRILRKDSLTHSEYSRIVAFARGYFGEFAGYAQQYLYHYERGVCGGA